jgi:excisionase family DNA binding protein
MNLITVQEAAQRLNVTDKAIYSALANGSLTRHEQWGRVLVDAEEVAAYTPRAYRDRPRAIRPRKTAAKEGTVTNG